MDGRIVYTSYKVKGDEMKNFADKLIEEIKTRELCCMRTRPNLGKYPGRGKVRFKSKVLQSLLSTRLDRCDS